LPSNKHEAITFVIEQKRPEENKNYTTPASQAALAMR
jgi:hypothetical protein